LISTIDAITFYRQHYCRNDIYCVMTIISSVMVHPLKMFLPSDLQTGQTFQF